MDHNSLVLRISQVDKDINKDISETFVFYDDTQNLFKICGGQENTFGNCKEQDKDSYNSFSFYSDDIDSLVDFIDLIHKGYDDLSIYLVKYVNMPQDSDDIDYDYLCLNFETNNEITYRRYYNDKHNLKDIKKYLNIFISNWISF